MSGLTGWHRQALREIATGNALHDQYTPVTALEELIRLERADALKELTAGVGLVLRCAFCGVAYPKGTPDHKHAGLEAHIRVCELHPLGIENRELRKALESAKEQLMGAGLWNGAVAAACRKKP